MAFLIPTEIYIQQKNLNVYDVISVLTLKKFQDSN